MLLGATRIWDLALNQQTPDSGSYGHSMDDIVHTDLFPETNWARALTATFQTQILFGTHVHRLPVLLTFRNRRSNPHGLNAM
jgi:hypothetical protein